MIFVSVEPRVFGNKAVALDPADRVEHALVADVAPAELLRDHQRPGRVPVARRHITIISRRVIE
jgi:hypothetical protein